MCPTGTFQSPAQLTGENGATISVMNCTTECDEGYLIGVEEGKCKEEKLCSLENKLYCENAPGTSRCPFADNKVCVYQCGNHYDKDS